MLHFNSSQFKFLSLTFFGKRFRHSVGDFNKLKLMFGIFIFITSPSFSQNNKKVKIERAEQLPAHTYAVKDSLELFIKDEKAMQQLLSSLKKDMLSDLSQFEIAPNLLKNYYKGLGVINYYENDFDKAIAYFDSLKHFELKPAAQLTNAIVKRAQIKAKLASSGDYISQFRKVFTENIQSLQFSETYSSLENTRRQYKNTNAATILAGAAKELNPLFSGGHLSQDDAVYVLWLKFELPYFDRESNVIESVLDSFFAVNQSGVKNIWPEREVVLDMKENYTPVVICVFDLGTDVSLFPQQLYSNSNEIADGKDNDGNGFVDDIHGVAFDINENKTTALLMPTTAKQEKELPAMISFFKGYTDDEAGLKTQEANLFRSKMDSAGVEEKEMLNEQINFIGDYIHGTHVAGIALKGNPFARMLTVRFTDDVGFTNGGNGPSEAREKKVAQNLLELVKYWKTAKVRVVTMSWGYFLSDYETDVQNHYPQLNEIEKKELAFKLWTMRKESLLKAFSLAPEILFIASCGNKNTNSDNDLRFPAALDLPNVMGIGSVNSEGNETSFTSTGNKVAVHANGYMVESLAPGGQKVLLSGTSMATPYVANLASKLIAIQPALTPMQVISLIKEGADHSSDGRVRPVHPKRTVELLKTRFKK